MTYRPDGVRQQVADSGGSRDLVWDSRGSSGYGDLLQERSAGSAVRTYHRGDLLAALAEAGAAGSRYYHWDTQGSLLCLTHGTGAAVDRLGLDPWGSLLTRAGSSGNRLWYNGDAGYYREVDREEDYVRQRTYAPRVGRWRSVFEFGALLADSGAETLRTFDISRYAAMYSEFSGCSTSDHICAVQLPQACWYNFAAGCYGRVGTGPVTFWAQIDPVSNLTGEWRDTLAARDQQVDCKGNIVLVPTPPPTVWGW